MNTLVVYESGTGFTAKYADWIAAKLSTSAKNIKRVTKNELEEADLVIFGGWIMGNNISGLNKIKSMNCKKLIVFAVGSSKNSDKLVDTIINQNNLGDTPFYYMEGGIKFEKLGFIKKMMLNMVKKSISKKENKTEEDIDMEKKLSASFDNTDISYIEPLLKKVNEY